MFNLKIKEDNKTFKIDSLTSESLLSSLYIVICEKIPKLTSKDFKLRFQYPPVFLETKDNFWGKGDVKTLKEVGIVGDECINIEYTEIGGNESDVDTNELLLTIEKVAADNSCLFSSICLLMQDSSLSPDKLRNLVVDKIKSKPIVYNQAILSKPPKDYCEWMLKPDTWGGYIELSILSEYFRCQFIVFNVQNVSFLKFGECYDDCAYFCYNGQHYDPMVSSRAVRSLSGRTSSKKLVTIFKRLDSKIFKQGLEIASTLHATKSFASSSMTFFCNDCNKTFYSSQAASKHTLDTNHVNFTEVI